MRLLVCGLNPSLYAADAGVTYARPGNRFWPAALAAGIVSVDRDPWHALAHHGVGWSDLVKRATVGAAELTGGEYQAGAARLAWTVRLLQPRAVCFVGLAGYRAAFDPKAVAGPVAGGFAGAAAYLMPSTSGLNARATPAELADHLRRATALG
jgi:TDG/mug DNA glycosylase family protein